MPNIYITTAERHILSYIAGGKFRADDRQLIHDYVIPTLTRELVRDYGVDDAIDIIQGVIDRVEIRHFKAKDHRNRYELACYLSFLRKAKARIEHTFYPHQPEQRSATFMEAVSRIMGRPFAPTSTPKAQGGKSNA